jgi:restriction system protein
MPKRRSTNDPIPPYHQMLWPTLQAIIALGGSGSNQEIEDRAIEIAGYTEEQLSVLHNDGPNIEIRYRMAWARSYLKVVGALQNSARSVWSVTDYGRSLTQSDMAAIPAQSRAISRRNKAQLTPQPDIGDLTSSEDDSLPAEIVEPFKSVTFEDWRDKLLQVIQAMPPANFERLSQRILRESGFSQVEVTGKSGDGGIDGIGVLAISLLSFQVFFQCKRYKGSVGASDIRNFRGAMMGRTDKGLFITTGSFTPEARKEATRDGAPVLDLIDGEKLCKLLKDLGLGVSTKQVEEVSIDDTWFMSI